MMDHYERDKTVVNEGCIAMQQFQLEEEETVGILKDREDKLFSGLGLDLARVTIMRVKDGSKVRNLLGFALKKIKVEDTKHIIFTGSGSAISKTITCVEIVKRNMKTLHQVSKIYHKRIAEFWNPKEEGLDSIHDCKTLERLKVTRDIPAIALLLSKESLDVSEPGYQAPGSFCNLWTDSAKKDTKKTQPRKRTNPQNSREAKRTAHHQSSSAAGDSKATPGKPRRKSLR